MISFFVTKKYQNIQKNDENRWKQLILTEKSYEKSDISSERREKFQWNFHDRSDLQYYNIKSHKQTGFHPLFFLFLKKTQRGRRGAPAILGLIRKEKLATIPKANCWSKNPPFCFLDTMLITWLMPAMKFVRKNITWDIKYSRIDEVKERLLKIWSDLVFFNRSCQFHFFKGYFPKNLLGPFWNTLSRILRMHWERMG